MSSVYLTFPIDDSTLGRFVFDAVVSEESAFEADVSEYAVELGADITDNISASKETLTLSGVLVGAGIASAEGDVLGRSKLVDAKIALKGLMERRLPVTVVTPEGFYGNMAISRASLTRADAFERLAVSMTLKSIRLVESRTTIVPRKVANRAKGKAGATEANGGKTAGKSADPTKKEQTALAKMTKGGKSVSDVVAGN